MPKYCPECGKRGEPSDKFCKECGASLGAKATAPVKELASTVKPKYPNPGAIGLIIIIGAIILGYYFMSSSEGVTCPEEAGYASCGYCAEDAMLSSNPHAGKCVYCSNAADCGSDPCSVTCGSNSGGGGSTGPIQYFVSCGGCSGISSKSVSYRGYDIDKCSYYEQLCKQYYCTDQKNNC